MLHLPLSPFPPRSLQLRHRLLQPALLALMTVATITACPLQLPPHSVLPTTIIPALRYCHPTSHSISSILITNCCNRFDLQRSLANGYGPNCLYSSSGEKYVAFKMGAGSRTTRS